MNFNPAPIIGLVKAITGMTLPTVRYELERSKKLIEIRKKFNLLPDYPRSAFDFTWVYQYSVVEFSELKIKEYSDQALSLVKLLEQREIIEAFYQSFYQRDQSILREKGDFFIESSALGDYIRELKFDIHKELSDFQMIFMDIANSTRTPAELIQAQSIEELSKGLETIILTVSHLTDWNNFLALHSTKKLVRFEIEALSGSLEIAKPNNPNQVKIQLNQGFRLSYEIPFSGYTLLIQGIQSKWAITSFSDSEGLKTEANNHHHTQKRIKPVQKGNWSVPTDVDYMSESEDLGLHKFILILSPIPFPESIKKIILEEPELLTVESINIFLKYLKRNISSLKLIAAECNVTL